MHLAFQGSGFSVGQVKPRPSETCWTESENAGAKSDSRALSWENGVGPEESQRLHLRMSQQVRKTGKREARV